MRLLLRVLIVILGMTSSLQAQDTRQLFDQANELYQQGSFQEAAVCYEELAKVYPSANVYYNLGNAYYRQGKLGYAILNFERARRLAPRDQDIRYNLDYVRSLVPETSRWELGHIFGFFTPRELQVLLLVCYMIFLPLALLTRIRTRFMKTALAVLGVLILLSAVGLVYETESPPKGVVVIDETKAHFEPGLLGTVHFVLPEGAFVSIQKQREDWCLIQRQDRKRGWIPIDCLQRL